MTIAMKLVEQQEQGAKQDLEFQSAARRECLLMFMSSFGVDSPLVPVSKLARIIGKSKAWIYQSIRSGSFFLPTRTVGESHMVPVDDLIAWYLGTRRKGEAVVKHSSLSTEASASEDRREKERAVDICDLPEFDIDRLTAAAMKRVEATRKRSPR